MKKILLILLTTTLLFACKSDETSETKANKTQNTKPAKCYFSVVKEDVKFQWTAFKTTDKIGVKGSFDAISIKNDKSETDIKTLLIGTEISFDLPSVNSGNEARDKKIMEFFFGNLANAEIMNAWIKDVDGNNFEGKAFLALSINEIEDIVEMNYELKEKIITFSGDVDLLKWKAEKSFKELNNVCKDLHKGKDGVSKTWTTVHIEVSVPLSIDCK